MIPLPPHYDHYSLNDAHFKKGSYVAAPVYGAATINFTFSFYASLNYNHLHIIK
jgi:hypothetical protein